LADRAGDHPDTWAYAEGLSTIACFGRLQRADVASDQNSQPCVMYRWCMAPFVFRCPTTGRQVQGWTADDPTEDDDSYQSVTCLACTQVHLVNPKTGRVAGVDDD